MFVPVENTFSDKDIFEAVDALVPQMIRAIQNIVRIDSVQGSPMPEAPFGAGVKKALSLDLLRKTSAIIWGMHLLAPPRSMSAQLDIWMWCPQERDGRMSRLELKL